MSLKQRTHFAHNQALHVHAPYPGPRFSERDLRVQRFRIQKRARKVGFPLVPCSLTKTHFVHVYPKTDMSWAVLFLSCQTQKKKNFVQRQTYVVPFGETVAPLAKTYHSVCRHLQRLALIGIFHFVASTSREITETTKTSHSTPHHKCECLSNTTSSRGALASHLKTKCTLDARHRFYLFIFASPQCVCWDA